MTSAPAGGQPGWSDLVRSVYSYVGPKEIAAKSIRMPVGVLINSPTDVRNWAQQTCQEVESDGSVIATFVVDGAGGLRIADRRSEHVGCAGGKPVRSAGEMTFLIGLRDIEVVWVTNQSTGYWREPESWKEVEAALVKAAISPPDRLARSLFFGVARAGFH